MKLKVPQPLQRYRNRSGDIDLREESAVYDDTAEHDVYDAEETSATSPSYPAGPETDRATGSAFDGAQASGGSGDRGAGRMRSGLPRFDIRNTWQVLAGSILIPVGVAAIILAWYGAAHARVDQQQIPYMISGGFLGLGAIIAGALMYWAHWLYRIYDQADLHHHQLMRSQAELRDAILSGGSGVSRDRNLNGSVGAPVGSRAQNRSTFVATASGSNFHRPDCAIVARHPSGLREVEGKDLDQLHPCRICDPLGEGS